MADQKSHGPDVGKSQIFAPYRAIGYVANHVPLDLVSRRTVHLAVTSVGKSFHIYNVRCFFFFI